ncbi:hypothetical protein [Staphylospora marina]|uniref:hypothetical protein n=1 Tax=Staphylospora marina TaxID=2490858 RepID=UPI000F5BF1BA|nr:hypothetical protein [Staphylospora marina]
MRCPVCKSEQIQKRREKINWLIQVILPCIGLLLLGFFFLFAGILMPPFLLMGIVCFVAALLGPFIEWSKSNLYLCSACGSEWRRGGISRQMSEKDIPLIPSSKVKHTPDQSKKREDKGKSIVNKAQTPISNTSQTNYFDDDDD